MNNSRQDDSDFMINIPAYNCCHYLNKSNLGIILQLAIPKMHQNTGNHIYQIQNFLGEDPSTPLPPFSPTFIQIR